MTVEVKPNKKKKYNITEPNICLEKLQVFRIYLTPFKELKGKVRQLLFCTLMYVDALLYGSEAWALTTKDTPELEQHK